MIECLYIKSLFFMKGYTKAIMDYQDKKPRRERGKGKPTHREFRDSFDTNCRRMQRNKFRKDKYGY